MCAAKCWGCCKDLTFAPSSILPSWQNFGKHCKLNTHTHRRWSDGLRAAAKAAAALPAHCPASAAAASEATTLWRPPPRLRHAAPAADQHRPAALRGTAAAGRPADATATLSCWGRTAGAKWTWQMSRRQQSPTRRRCLRRRAGKLRRRQTSSVCPACITSQGILRMLFFPMTTLMATFRWGSYRVSDTAHTHMGGGRTPCGCGGCGGGRCSSCGGSACGGGRGPCNCHCCAGGAMRGGGGRCCGGLGCCCCGCGC